MGATDWRGEGEVTVLAKNRRLHKKSDLGTLAESLGLPWKPVSLRLRTLRSASRDALAEMSGYGFSQSLSCL